MPWPNVKAQLLERVRRSPIAPYLAGLKSLMEHPKEQLDILRDLQKTSEQLRFLSAPPNGSHAGTLLIGSMTAYIMQIKQEAIIAQAFRLKGLKVVPLVSRIHPWSRKFFEAFGIEDFVYWEDLKLSDEEERLVRDDTKKLLSAELTFPKVKGWRYQDTWIGPQLLSSIVRKEHRGCPDLSDPRVRSDLEAVLPKALTSVFKSKKLIDELKPSILLLNEPNGPVIGPLTDAGIAKKIPIIFYTQPSKDDAMILKKLNTATRRIHPNSVTLETLSNLEQSGFTALQDEALWKEIHERYDGTWYLQRRNQPDTKPKTRSELFSELGIDPSKKIAVIFSHVLWDANLFYGDDLFDDYGHWYMETIKAACANPNLNWVIKVHPANVWKRKAEQVTTELTELALIREKIGTLPAHVKLLLPDTEISTLSLFENIDYGVTVRGTIGIELPCFGVPVLTAGTGRYSNLGFTIDSQSQAQYLDRLSNLHALLPLSDEQVRKAKIHAYAIFKLRPWKIRSFSPVFKPLEDGRLHPLHYNIQIHAHSLEDIQRFGDLDKLYDWAVDPDRVDYLNEEMPKLRTAQAVLHLDTPYAKR